MHEQSGGRWPNWMSKMWKKIYVVKKILGIIFLNLIFLYILNYFYHFQPFLYYKNLVRFNLGIRIKKSQCVLHMLPSCYNASTRQRRRPSYFGITNQSICCVFRENWGNWENRENQENLYLFCPFKSVDTFQLSL